MPGLSTDVTSHAWCDRALEARVAKDEEAIADLRRQLAKLSNDREAAEVAAQQRIAFLEGQGQADGDELAAAKKQVPSDPSSARHVPLHSSSATMC